MLSDVVALGVICFLPNVGFHRRSRNWRLAIPAQCLRRRRVLCQSLSSSRRKQGRPPLWQFRPAAHVDPAVEAVIMIDPPSGTIAAASGTVNNVLLTFEQNVRSNC